MAFRIELQPHAIEDLDFIAEYLTHRGSVAASETWFNGIMGQIETLEELPERCPIAPESTDAGHPGRKGPDRVIAQLRLPVGVEATDLPNRRERHWHGGSCRITAKQ